MSFAIDANILLYASDESSSECGKARQLLETWIDSKDTFFLTWPTVMAYLRIATHPSIFSDPLSHAEAMENVEMLINCPHVRMLGEEEGFWECYKDITGEVPTRGNLVPDAHIAAIMRQYGIKTIYTRDRDFRKFGNLKAIDPFA